MTRGERTEVARRLRAEGMTNKAIAVEMGVSAQAVGRWLDPDVAATARATSRRWKEQNRERNRARDRERRWRIRAGEPTRSEIPPFYRILQELEEAE